MAAVWSSTKLLEFDFAGIEAVILGWNMGSRLYTRLAKLGMHAYVASHALGRPADLAWSDAELAAYFLAIKKATDHPTQVAYEGCKRTVHGTGYGMTAMGTYLQFPHLFPTLKAAEHIREVYFTCAPELPEFHAALRHTAYTQGYFGGASTYTYDRAKRWVSGHPYQYQLWLFSVVQYDRLNTNQVLWRKKRGMPVEVIHGISYGVKLGEDGKRCVPPDYKVWMGDYSHKAIGDIKVGDTVIGWVRGTKAKRPYRGTENTKYMTKRKAFRTDTLVRSKVLATQQYIDRTLTIKLASGKVLRCTADHEWLVHRRHGYEYIRADRLKITDQMCRVDVTDPGGCPPELRETAAWLGGFYDGEGSHHTVSQTDSNYGLVEHAEQAFASLGFDTSRRPLRKQQGAGWKSASVVSWLGGRQAALKFARWVPSHRYAAQWADRMILGSRFRRLDRIISIEKNAVAEPVVCITTETGNYVVEDTCSHNCCAYYPQSIARGVLTEAAFPLFDPEDPLADRCYVGDLYYGDTPLRAPIHDSFLFECPTRKVDRLIERVAYAMQRPVEALSLPADWDMGTHLTIGVDAKMGDDWGAMTSVRLPSWAEIGVAGDSQATPSLDEDAGGEEEAEDWATPLRVGA